MNDLIEYERIVERLAESRSSEMISNSSAEHASILIRTMFKNAANTINIFNGCLANVVYGRDDIIKAAKGFVVRGGKITVVIQDQLADSEIITHSFVKEFKDICCENERKGEFKIYRADGSCSDLPSHFFVMDDSGYRLEQNKDEPKAFATFNDTEIAGKLNDLFSSILQVSSRVPCN